MYLALFAILVFGWYFLAALRADENGLGRRLPRAPRLTVKWGLVDIILILLFFQISAVAMRVCLPEPIHIPQPTSTNRVPYPAFETAPFPGQRVGETDTATSEAELKREHPLTQLVARVKNEPSTLLLVVFCAVIVAPIAEEFLFRLLFQGGFQRLTNRLLTGEADGSPEETPEGGKIDPKAVATLQIVPVALLFAAVHFRSDGSGREISVETLQYGIFMGTGAMFLMSMAGIAYLAAVRGMRLRDFGVDPGRLVPDMLCGLTVFFLVLPPMFCLKEGLGSVFPDSEHLLDPAPLFFFACALGFLFYRTQRIVPCIVLHAALNTTALVLLLVST